jgi:hypothetical protein
VISHPDDAIEDQVAPPQPSRDIVEEAGEESFPASDPPARTVVTGTRVGSLEPAGATAASMKE